jgi:hypothetical protein
MEKYFELIAGDEYLIVETIKYYNEKYNSDFFIENFEDKDGVLFAKIRYVKSTVDDIFQLGCFFGMRIQYKRDRKEIEW